MLLEVGVSPFEDASVFITTVLVLSLGLLFYMAYWLGYLYYRDSLWLFHRRIKRGKVVIGYKKAYLNGPSASDPFMGVAGRRHYAVDAVAYPGSPGFHAYKTIKAARAHEQEGTVLLEVVLSGTITHRAKGFVAERQRVLQIIPYSCSIAGCEGAPSRFSSGSGPITFYCAAHAPASVAETPFVPRGLFDAAGRLVVAEALTVYRAGALAMLPTLLPWLREHRIVVAELEGPDKFVPTIPLSPVDEAFRR